MAIVICPECGAKNRVDERRASLDQPKCGRCGALLPAAVDGGAVMTVTDASFARDVLQGDDRPVLVDCWAAWCGPCRAIAPVIEQLAAESVGRYRVGKLNVDENPRIAGQFRIQSIPALLIFKNGKLVDQLIGAHPKPSIVQKLLQWVGK